MAEIETTLAQSLQTADDKAKYDAACKRLLSEKSILAWIMKSCLEEYQDCSINEIAEKYIEGQPQVSTVAVDPDADGTASRIQGMNSEDVSQTEGIVLYDIRFSAIAPVSGETIRLIINLEAQNAFSKGYPILKRAIYYCSRMISAQHGPVFTKSQYGKIRKVYSIWVCVSPPREMENTITRYRITEENMVGRVRKEVRDYDLMTVILLCLGDPDGENYGGILKLLEGVLSPQKTAAEKKQILKDDFGIPMTETLEKEVYAMCNLSEGVEARGIAKGRVEGRMEGRMEGRAEGILSALQNLMESMNLTIDQAMNALMISEADRPKYRSLLEQQ